jgi:hypothetical protein
MTRIHRVIPARAGTSWRHAVTFSNRDTALPPAVPAFAGMTCMLLPNARFCLRGAGLRGPS